MLLINETLQRRLERARKLYQWLYLEPRIVNRDMDAETYLDKMREYRFTVELFEEMQCFNWLNKEFTFDGD